MRHVYAVTLGLIIGGVVWLSTGSTGLGLGIALGLSILFVFMAGIMPAAKRPTQPF